MSIGSLGRAGAGAAAAQLTILQELNQRDFQGPDPDRDRDFSGTKIICSLRRIYIIEHVQQVMSLVLTSRGHRKPSRARSWSSSGRADDLTRIKSA